MIITEEIKSLEREFWGGNAADYDARLGAYSGRFCADLIDYLSPQKGERGLDIGGGSGAAGLKMAARIGVQGSVTIVDLAPEMLRIASDKAIAHEFSNVQTVVMDAEKLEFADSTFDLASCSFAAPSFPNISLAIAEMKRILRPGGRAGFVIWSHPDRFPLFVEHASALAHRTLSIPTKWLIDMPSLGKGLRRRIITRPGPWGLSPLRFSTPGSLESELTRAGFEDVRRKPRAFPIEFASFEDYWQTALRVVPLQAAHEASVSAIKEQLRAKIVNNGDGRMTLWNEAAVILAKNPA
jgi:ubiquinone/menaquinone biosynthesis C-methylase UbiE